MNEEPSLQSLTEERLKLEREALQVERDRLAAARARLEVANEIAASSRHTGWFRLSIFLVAIASFAAGTVLGVSLSETRHRKANEARFSEAMSRLGDFAGDQSSTNRLSVLIIQ